MNKEIVMFTYQNVNGIPRPVTASLQKVDFLCFCEKPKADPHYQLTAIGFSQKQSFILELSAVWEEIKSMLQSDSNKETIMTFAQQRGIKI